MDNDKADPVTCGNCGDTIPPDDARLCPHCVAKILLQAEFEDGPPGAERADDPGELPTFKIGGYQLHAMVGSGGMGHVYRATRASDRKEVAVKILRAPWLHSEQVRERFRREVETASAISDPRTVTILESGLAREEQLFYYVMEFVDGVPITSFAAEGRLDKKETLELFLDLCGGISEVHRIGVLHRDIKPSNILINTQGRVKILDFGLARFLESGIEQGDLTREMVIGTEGYAAPELSNPASGPPHQRLDVFSLGIVLRNLLEVCKCQPPPRSDLAAICEMATATEPENRYQSVDALAEDLHRHLRGESTIARPQTTVQRVAAVLNRHPKTTAASVAAVIALAALATGMTLFGIREAAARRALTQETDLLLSRLSELYLTCESSDIESVYQSLIPYSSQLHGVFGKSDGPAWPEHRSHARIAAFQFTTTPPGPALVDQLSDLILRSDDFEESAFLARRLKPWSDTSRKKFWEQLLAEPPPKRKALRLATALAVWAPDDQIRWPRVARLIAIRAWSHCAHDKPRQPLRAALKPVFPYLRLELIRLWNDPPRRTPDFTAFCATMIDPELQQELNRIVSSDDIFTANFDRLRQIPTEAATWYAGDFYNSHRWADPAEYPVQNRILAARVMIEDINSDAWWHFRSIYKTRPRLIENFRSLGVPATLIASRLLAIPQNTSKASSETSGLLFCLATYPPDELPTAKQAAVISLLDHLPTRPLESESDRQELANATIAIKEAWEQ